VRGADEHDDGGGGPASSPRRRLSHLAGVLDRAAQRLSASRPLALVALALAVLADLVAGKSLGLLAIPPLVAALALGLRATATIAAASVIASAAMTVPASGHPAAKAAHVLAVAVAGTLAIWLVRLRDEREQLLARIAAVARIAQEAIVRPPAPLAASAAFAARYVAASQDAAVGGDLYEAVITPYGVRIVIGDVRGKGLEAVRTAASVLRAFRNRCQLVPDLAQLVGEIDREVRGALDSGEFVTAIFAELSPSGVLDIVNCGHPAPLCVTSHSAYLLEPSHRTTPLGIEPTALVDRFHLTAGERLLFYTDGLFDVGRGPTSALLAAAERSLRAASLEEALDALIGELVGDPARATDDAALLLIEHRAPRRSFVLTAV
jgi:serine phosphatase RsbU (regulator of sigma subunit)